MLLKVSKKVGRHVFYFIIEESGMNKYSTYPHLILGYHGCSRHWAEKVLNDPTQHLKMSKNPYDWLGHGIYFWENDPGRAWTWAQEKHCKEPYVLGALIDLKYCLDLTNQGSLLLLKSMYFSTVEPMKLQGLNVPINNGLRRDLDCFIINAIYEANVLSHEHQFDSARAMYPEGNIIFPGTEIREKTHVQICIRSTDCIKGYFRVNPSEYL